MLQRVFIFLILILVLPDIYIYWTYFRKIVRPTWIKIAYWLPTLILLSGITSLLFFANHHFAEQHPQWIGCFAVFFFLFASPKLVFTLCTLIGLPFNRWLHWPKAPFVYTGLILGTLNAGMILYGSLIGKSQFEVKEITYQSPRIPSGFDGYRIVQLSDIHIGSWLGNTKDIQRLVDLVNVQHPDLIVFTGDLVNNRAVELNDFQEILSGLRAKDGVYAILGNHDYGPYFHWENPLAQEKNLQDLKNRQLEMGWKMLNNEHTILWHNNDSIALIGVENEGEPPFSQYGDLSKAMEGTDGMFRILLSHNPTHWRREVLPKSDIDLMLAGHTHAMQLAIGHHSPSSFVYPEWSGMYKEGDQALYVNVGIGYVGLPFRFGAWPEVTVITLKKEK